MSITFSVVTVIKFPSKCTLLFQKYIFQKSFYVIILDKWDVDDPDYISNKLNLNDFITNQLHNEQEDSYY